MTSFVLRSRVVLPAVLALAPPAFGGALPCGVVPSGRTTDAVVVRETSVTPFLVRLARTQFETARRVCPAAQGRPARLLGGRIADAGKRTYQAFQEKRSAIHSVMHMFKPSPADPRCSFEVVPIHTSTVVTVEGDRNHSETHFPFRATETDRIDPHGRVDGAVFEVPPGVLVMRKP